MKRSFAALLALSLAACGQKGPLYLPDTTHGEIVTRPSAPPTPGTPPEKEKKEKEKEKQ
jgi:predicted small lipoprotein YifL